MEGNFFVEQAEGKAKDLEPENQAMVTRATALQVVDDQTYLTAAEIGKEATRRIKVVKESFENPRTMAHGAWKAIVALEKKITDPLEAIKGGMSKKMGFYDREKEKKAREVEEKRLAEAKEKADQAALEHAQALEKAGDDEGAARTLEDAVDVNLAPAPQPIERAPAVKGISHRTYWKYRIVNRDLIPDEFWDVVERRIQDRVNSMKKDTHIPGVEVFEERKAAYR